MSMIKKALEKNDLDYSLSELSTDNVDKLTIAFTSDTHGELIPNNELPEADIIVHAGDTTLHGTESESLMFLEWFEGLNYKHKILIPGNHDRYFEDSIGDEAQQKKIESYDVHVLIEGGVTINGVKFYGCSWQPIFYNWAFNVTESELIKHWERIPNDTDVLITHVPPFGVLDKNSLHMPCGSESLGIKTDRLTKLKFHLFGHIHESYGERFIGGVYKINGSRVSDSRLSGMHGKNPVRVLEIKEGRWGPVYSDLF